MNDAIRVYKHCLLPGQGTCFQCVFLWASVAILVCFCGSFVCIDADETAQAVPLTTSETDEASQFLGDAEWLVEDAPRAIQIENHVIEEAGSRIRRFRIRNIANQKTIVIRSLREQSRVHDDFSGSVRIHASHTGIQIGLEIGFPDQTDPRTGGPLRTVVSGDQYLKEEQWQTLRVSGAEAATLAQLRRLRTELQRSDLDIVNAHISGITLAVDAVPGEMFVDIAESEYGPVVSFPKDAGVAGGTDTAEEKRVESAVSPVRLSTDLHNILLNENPVILRFTPDHGESVSLFHQLGMNAVWISDSGDLDRVKELRDAGIAVIATPPHPEFEPGDFSTVVRGLPPLDQLCPGVSAFMLGTRVTPDQLPHLLSWSREARSADRKLERLHLADVTGAEGAASREIELVGIGRHGVGRVQSFGELRNQLIRKRTAGPLASPWTWIQVHPSAQQMTWRTRTGEDLPYVEPEQIQMQVHAAISGGCKGVAFWKERMLDQELPGDRETSVAIELASLELLLLEPLLAVGRVDGHWPLQLGNLVSGVSGQSGGKSAKGKLPWLSSSGKSSLATMSTTGQEEPAGPDAAVIGAGNATLILSTAWDQSSQYVPGEMAAGEVSFVVAASETATAYQISTTHLRALPKEVQAGGLGIRIRDFDRHASVIVTSEPDLVRSLERRMHQVAERSAKLSLELAQLKYRRVLLTTERIAAVRTLPASTDGLLAAAREKLERAEHVLEQGAFHEAALIARSVLQSLRGVQRQCWLDAAEGVISPSAVPHLVSFATLPAHWRMMQEIQARTGQESPNLLPSGDFESSSQWSESGWQLSEMPHSGHSCSVNLIPDAPSGNSVLSLSAWLPKHRQTHAVLKRDDSPLLVVSTPPVAVQGGDIVRVTCRIRRVSRIPAQSKHPVMLFDSESGPENGIRPILGQEWIPLELIREIAPGSESFQFLAALTAMSEVHLDNLSITRLPESGSKPEAAPVSLPGSSRTLTP